jgi:dethiobiotin synthetase
MGPVLFVTGTDTGVGKTVVTALLLAHAQSQGMSVRALKPFSSGGREDETLLRSLQPPSFPINFFHYPEPIAPRSAARLQGAPVTLEEALATILAHREHCDLLLVEGAGGLLTPLGDRFDASDLISALSAETIVVAANRLGVLNHTLLTIQALRHRSTSRVRIALVEQNGADISCRTNLQDLAELLENVPIITIPYLPNFAADAAFIRRVAIRIKPALSELLAYKKNPPDTEAEGTFP